MPDSGFPNAAAVSAQLVSEPVVDAGALSKNYTFHEQDAGLRSAVKSLFHRRYQTRVAVDDITFAIGTGEIVGLLGRNGAGKTTTLKMLCGLLRPTAGDLLVLGHEPVARSFAFRSRISVVLGRNPCSGGTSRRWTAFSCTKRSTP